MIVAEYLILVLLALVSYVTYREKNRYFYARRDVYSKLMLGMACWLVTLLIRAASESGLEQGLPILQNADYRFFAEATLLACGALFFALAAIRWITSVAASDQRATRLRKCFDLLTAVGSARQESPGVESRLDDIRTLITEFTGAISVNYYRRDEAAGRLVPAEGNSVPVSESIQQAKACQTVIETGRVSILTAGVGASRRPTAIVRLSPDAGQFVIMVINWHRGAEIGTETAQLLDLLTAQLTQQQTWEAVTTPESEPVQTVLAELRYDLAGAEQIEEKMHHISSALQRILPHDILRVAVYDTRGYNVTQHSLGQGKNLVSERGKSISTHKTQLGALFHSPTIVYTDRLDVSVYEDDRWLASCGAACALSIPIMVGDKAVAIVTLASVTPGLSKSVAEEISSDLSVTLLPIIKSDIFTQQLVSYNRQILDLTSALKQLVSTEDTERLLGQLADLIVRKLPVSFCRIWSYDSDRDQLELAAESQIRDLSKQVSEVKTLSVSKMQWHKLALRTGRMMLVNQQEERMQMDQQELIQSMISGMQSALIVPIMAGNEPIGAMALSELRSWERRNFSLPDTLFVRGIANIAAQALLATRKNKAVTLLNNRLEQLEKGRLANQIALDLPKRMATPLTSIMARTQQVLDRVGTSDERTVRHLEVIKKQTEKMMDEVRAIQDGKREQADQMT
jgi:transcriptional regulator with GAF, ATPase, and Fis domain